MPEQPAPSREAAAHAPAGPASTEADGRAAAGAIAADESDKAYPGWAVARYAAAQAFFAWGLGFYGPAVFVQALHQQHGWRIGLVSAAVSAHFLLGAAAVLWLPQAHQRFGLRRCTLAGLLLSALGTAAWNAAQTPWQLGLAVLPSAVGWSLTSGACLNALLAPWFARERPRAIALAFNGATAGGLVFAPLWTALHASLGLPLSGLLLAALMLLTLAPLAFRLLQRRPAPRAPTAAGAAPAPALPSRRALLVHPAFLGLALPFGLAFFAQVGLLAHLIGRLTPVLGGAGAAAALSTVAVSALFGRSLLAAWLGERDRRRAAAANFLVQAAGTLLLLLGGSAPLLLAGCVLYGLGFGNLTSLPPLIAQQRFAAHETNTVVALLVAVNQSLMAIAPGLFGLLHDASASYAPAFALALAAQVAAAAWMWLQAGRSLGRAS